MNTKRIRLKEVEIHQVGSQDYLRLGHIDVPIIDIKFSYEESRFRSTLLIQHKDHSFKIVGFKSIWEQFRLSTYDHIEKCEDNAVYHLASRIDRIIQQSYP